MIHTSDIEEPVENIRTMVEKIRTELPQYELATVSDMLDEIEEDCNTLANLEEGEPDSDDPVYEMLEDLGLSGLWDTYHQIDVGTANDLKEAFTKIVKFHGYPAS